MRSILFLTLVGLVLMGADCGTSTTECSPGTAIPNVDFEAGSRACLPIEEICFTEDRSSTIACADCPTCEPYEPPDGAGGASGHGGAAGRGGAGGATSLCATSMDCQREEAARCDTDTGDCVACIDDLDCVAVGGRPRCDGDQGLCVECRPASEALDCGETTCNPANLECTETIRGSRGVCETCVSDSDCELDLSCVPMVFRNTPRATGYCLHPIDSDLCAQPFALVLPDDRESLSGADARQYCGINEQLTTCEAAWALLDDTECASDANCPSGGICREVGQIGLQCTYECIGADACPEGPAAGSTCGDADGVAEERYCGG